VRYALLLVLAVGLGAMSACVKRDHHVRMRLTKDNLVQREITVSATEGDKPVAFGAERIERLQSLYADAEVQAEGESRFAGTFAGELPGDVWHAGFVNRGHLACATSPLGTTRLYVERMPGRSDVVGSVRAAGALADAVVKILVAYAREHAELKDQPEKLAALGQFCEGELRHDLENALLLHWVAGVQYQFAAQHAENVPDGVLGTAAFLRLAYYLTEQGYLRGDDLVLLQSEPWPPLARGVLRRFATVLGYSADEPLPALLARLQEEGQWEAAFEAGREASGISEEEFSELVSAAGFKVTGDWTMIDVAWSGRPEPWLTNGRWDEAAGEVRWQAEGRDGSELPAILFAQWAEPDEAYQEGHFGKVVLTGEALAEYNAWRLALEGEQLGEWDAFVEALRPGEDLGQRIDAFRFDESKSVAVAVAGAEEEQAETPRGAQILLGGLEGR
jgi:hypothetical protein